jgi:hypothetical protein
MHLGFDRLRYPGDDVMQSLWEHTPLSFVAVYLAPAPSQRRTAWMAHVADLKAAGWGLAPVYVGQQAVGGPGSHVLTEAQGATDAADAAALATAAGLDEGSVVYLDVEQGGLLAADFLAYVEAWVAGVQETDLRPGAYCSRQTAQQLTARLGELPVWVYRGRDLGPSTIDLATEPVRDPADSGFADALVWQYRLSLDGSVDLAWTDDTGPRTLEGVDLDCAVCLDPSHPVLPSPSLIEVTPGSGATGDTVSVTGTELAAVTDLAFGALSAADMAIVADDRLEAVVPGGIEGETVTLVATNRWGNQSADLVEFAVSAAS